MGVHYTKAIIRNPQNPVIIIQAPTLCFASVPLCYEGVDGVILTCMILMIAGIITVVVLVLSLISLNSSGFKLGFLTWADVGAHAKSGLTGG